MGGGRGSARFLSTGQYLVVHNRPKTHGDAAKEEFEAAVVGGIDGRSAQAEGSQGDGSQPDYFE